MTYLNAQERQALATELADMKFNQAKNKLARMDKQGRMVFYRNVQEVGKWETRYDLEGMGTRVTLVEAQSFSGSGSKVNMDYMLTDVLVEPLAGNKT